MSFLNNLLAFFLESNTIGDYLTALWMFLGLFLIFTLFDFYLVYFLKKASKKTKTTWDDVLIDFIERIHWPFYIYLAFYIASLYLILPETFSNVLKYLLVIFIAYYAAQGLINISNQGFEEYKKIKKKKDEHASESMIGVMKFLIKLIVWSVALLMVLSNFGINITPLIAGLGVGGIAIGLALQNILGDLFSAFAIYFDKPFKEGDFIIIGNDMGVVKHIGIKTTRIQALGGQELIMSNSELTSTRINNYKKMNSRRVVFEFGVEYKTSVKQLKKIKKIVKKIIDDEKHTKLDRVHFKKFGDSSLIFEVVYYVDTNDYNVYMDVQEDINLKIKELIEKEGIDFAFPTQTIFLEK